MKVLVTPAAQRDLNKLEKGMKFRVLLEMKYLKNYPDVKNVKKLKGAANEWRLRVENHRIRFTIEGDVIYVLRILARKDAYRQ